MRVLLGSKSPRRKELLSMLAINFDVVSIDCEEDYPKSMLSMDVAQYLSEKKSMAYKSLNDSELLITSDTVVVVNDKVLNKPRNKSEALEMLNRISGKTHQVITGVTIRTKEKTISFSSMTDVSMDKIDYEDKNFYINNYAILDKAGGYGIQDWLGLSHVNSINGCYYNVMGLPTNSVYKRLKDDFRYVL
ncbi:MAG: Maf family nucleotide pyrophosphatase [Bacteroidia bacterium]|nr:Maf family nucleotide pyrophosphatase [Bacteroidia bacterium]